MATARAGQIVVKLDLDNGQFTAKVTGATQALNQFLATTQKGSGQIVTAERRVKSWGNTVRDLVVTLGLARHAVLNLNAAVLGLPRAIIRANAELERMRTLMVGLSDGAGGYDAALRQAEDSVNQIFNMARSAPFDVATLTDSFVKMRTAGIEPMDGPLQALVDSVAKFGGQSEHFHRASIAIQQMSGKGVVSMEELRQQLGEAVPNAIQTMARALNTQMGELTKIIATGTVEAKNALTAMFRQMELENSGAALRMAQTWNGVMNRTKTRLMELAKAIGDSGFFEETKRAAEAFADDFLTSPEAIAAAGDLGRVLAELVRLMYAGTQALITYREEVLIVLALLVKLRVAWAVLQLVKNNQAKATNALKTAYDALFVSQDRVSKSHVTWAERVKAAEQVLIRQGHAVTKYNAQVNAAVHVMGRAASAAASAIMGFARAVAPAVAQFAFITGAVWALGEAWDWLQKKITGSKDDMQQAIDDFDPNLAGDEQTRELERRLAEQTRLYAEAVQARQRLTSEAKVKPISGEEYAELRRQARMGADLEREAAELAQAQAKINEARAIKSRRDMSRQMAREELQIAEQSMQAQAVYVRELNELRQRVAEEGGTAAEQTKRIEEGNLRLMDELIDRQVQLIETRKEQIAQQIKLEAQGRNDANQLVTLQGLYDELTKKAEDWESKRGQIGKLELLSEASSGKDTPLQNYLESLENKLATVGAKVRDVSPDFEKFMTMLDNGEFGDFDGSERAKVIEQVRAITDQIQAAQKAYEATTEAAEKLTREQRNVNKIDAALSRKLLGLAQDNPLMQAAVDVESYREQLQNTIDELTKAQAKIIELGGAYREDLAEGIKAAAEQMQRLESVQAAGPIATMRREVRQIEQDLMTDRQRIRAQYEQQVRYAEEIAEKFRAVWDTEQIAIYEDYMQAISDKYMRDMETPMQSLMREWQLSWEAMQDVAAQAMEGFIDTLTDELAEGEASFAQFTKNILKMILKIQLQKLAAGIVTHASDQLSALTTPAPNPMSSTQSAESYVATFYPHAKGGVMTPAGPMRLRKESRGGIAYAPKYALYGEGDQPEAYVPLPDGRRIPVSLEGGAAPAPAAAPTMINVINQTSVPVNASMGPERFDGRNYIKEVVLKEMSKPGAFRDAMTGK